MAVTASNKEKRKKNIKRNRMIALALVILAVCSILFFVMINLKPFAGGKITADLTTVNENREKQVNFLVCGVDNSSLRESTQLTDVIMIVNFNMVDNKVAVLQIPRDTYVGPKVTGESTGKMNAVYGSGKDKQVQINNLIKVIDEQFKIPIDHYVTIDTDAFVGLVDAIGGVKMNVPYNIGKDNGFDHTRTLKKGEQVLNGRQAELFVRTRKIYPEGDMGRINAQRLFLSALVQQMKESGISSAAKVVSALSGKIQTDMNVAVLSKYALNGMKVDLNNIEVHSVPGESMMHNGYSVYSIHLEQLAELLNAKYRTFGRKYTEEQLGAIELQNSESYYDNTGNTVEDLLNGATPGKDSINKKEPSDIKGGTTNNSNKTNNNSNSDKGTNSNTKK